MTELHGPKTSGDEAAPLNRTGAPNGKTAEEFVKEGWAAPIQAAANAVQPSTTEIERPQRPGAATTEQWKHHLKMAACCGAPLLALVILAGGGGALLGAAGALLPFLVLLACPVGMYFMMRSRSSTGDAEKRTDKGETR
ncbi:MAG: DUF2933 domain-containing protein [Candidatus Methylomirabilia bacterium]